MAVLSLRKDYLGSFDDEHETTDDESDRSINSNDVFPKNMDEDTFDDDDDDEEEGMEEDYPGIKQIVSSTVFAVFKPLDSCILSML